jgi:hypothetical protein
MQRSTENPVHLWSEKKMLAEKQRSACFSFLKKADLDHSLFLFFFFSKIFDPPK